MQRDFFIVDADGDGFLNHDEIEVLLNSRGYQDITEEYVQEIIAMFAGDDKALDYTEFRALCDWLEKNDADTAGDEVVDGGRTDEPDAEQAAEQDWEMQRGEHQVATELSPREALTSDEMEKFGAYCSDNGLLL